jgi:hypothetical protein
MLTLGYALIVSCVLCLFRNFLLFQMGDSTIFEFIQGKDDMELVMKLHGCAEAIDVFVLVQALVKESKTALQDAEMSCYVAQVITSFVSSFLF